jgi:quercetin dioxygenase-like cupin family protein
VQIAGFDDLETQWVDGQPELRWRSTVGWSADASANSLLEVPAGCALPRHTDSAEETVVVVAGTAEVELDGEVGRVGAGSIALIPKDVPHQVRNAGDDALRFVALYADSDVVTTYEAAIQPAGRRSQKVA